MSITKFLKRIKIKMFKTALERLWFKHEKENDMEESILARKAREIREHKLSVILDRIEDDQIVPGQTTVQEAIAESELSTVPVCNPDMLSEEEKLEFAEIQRHMGEANRALSALFDKAEERKRQERLAEEEKIRQAAEDMQASLDGNGKKKKDTGWVTWPDPEEYRQFREMISLVQCRIKPKPSGELQSESACMRSILRPFLDNPGKIVLIQDHEVKRDPEL